MAGAASKLALLAGVSAAPVQHVSAQEEAGAAARETGGKLELTEVVVTATRVESLASKTPLALSVFDADALRDANVGTVAHLGEIVPNLEVSRNVGLQFTLRGVTSNDTTEKGDPSVVMLNDGRYIARREFAEASFFDVARLEVLRGPQGTLYGRNATGGVINVITHKPTREFESTINGSVGSYGTRQMDAMVNMPVSDAVAVRIAGVYDRQDNFQNQAYETQFDLNPFKDNKAVRLQASFDITEDMNLLLRTEYSKLEGNPHTSGAPASNFYLETDAIGGTPVYIGDSRSTRELLTEYLEPAVQGKRDDSTFAFEADFVWNLGAVDLTYLGSYRTFDRNLDNNIFIAGLPRATAAPFQAEFRQDEHEVRISMAGEGPLQAQAGIYSFEERTDLNICLQDLIPGFPFLCYDRTPTLQTSQGLYGQATYSLTDSLRLTAGLRYTQDEKHLTGGGTRLQQAREFNEATDFYASQERAHYKDSRTTWRFGVDYDLTADTMLYGYIASGYKPGSFNDGVDGVTDPSLHYYSAEELLAYEIGAKAGLSDTVRLNAAAFFYDYTDQQLGTIVYVGAVPFRYTLNAGKSTVKGVELDSTILLGAHGELTLAATYLDAHYDEYLPLGEGSTISWAGEPLDRAPDYTFSAGYAHFFPLSNGAELVLKLNSRWSDSYVLSAAQQAQFYTQPSYAKSGATLTYNAPDTRYYVQGFVSNIENDVQVQGVARRGYATVSDPRLYGVKAGVKF